MLNVENQCEIGHANPHFTFTFVNLLTIAVFFYILYVIQLSDRVYNVTFPAYDLYSLRRREYRS